MIVHCGYALNLCDGCDVDHFFSCTCCPWGYLPLRSTHVIVLQTPFFPKNKFKCLIDMKKIFRFPRYQGNTKEYHNEVLCNSSEIGLHLELIKKKPVVVDAERKAPSTVAGSVG